MGRLFCGQVCSLSLVATMAWATTAHAGGVEDVSTGATAIGRSTNHVRANDALAVWQNPANLAVLPGMDIVGELRLGFFDACFSRAQDPNLTYLPTEVPFEKVCNDGGLQPAGTLGFSMPLPRGFGVGVGFFTPGAQKQTSYGHKDINTLLTPIPGLQATSGAHESPNRYLLIDRDTPVAFLMAGVGYQPVRYFRLGASFGFGFTKAKFSNVTSAIGGTFLDPQVLSEVEATDAFIPRVTASAVVSPIDAIDLMVSFTWTDDIEAEGHVDVTANGYGDAPRKDCREANPGPHCRSDDLTLRVPFQRYEVMLGARYAQRRVPRERALDPMRDEIWDVEVTGYWLQTSHIQDFVLDIHDGQRPVPQVAITPALVTPLPRRVSILHGWDDSFGVRVGGDYNVLRERLAVRAGFGYEGRAVPKKNMSIDYWAVNRYNLSVGSTVQLGHWKLTAAYTHVFHEDVDVPLGQGNLREIAVLMPDAANAVNEGKYRAQLNLLSLGFNYTF